MERETGIEPATSSLGSWHSTAELLPLLVPKYLFVQLLCKITIKDDLLVRSSHLRTLGFVTVTIKDGSTRKIRFHAARSVISFSRS
jgi:hypothetical protein